MTPVPEPEPAPQADEPKPPEGGSVDDASLRPLASALLALALQLREDQT